MVISLFIKTIFIAEDVVVFFYVSSWAMAIG
jgi:hypothetical protein